MSQMLCVEANMVGVTLPCHLWTSLSFVSRKEWVKLANCCNIYYQVAETTLISGQTVRLEDQVAADRLAGTPAGWQTDQPTGKYRNCKLLMG